MQDRDIRKILIEYLKIKYRDYRIYQEKSIGSSVCDVMLVTDKLIGFEIKSDSDNYERLQRQIDEYTNFFDENYIVVGESHSRHITEYVPEDWGILSINESNVCVIRVASNNKKVSRRKQLSILWKMELKNILVKNNLPLYAQKEKAFLAERIYETVPNKLLGIQIAEELRARDFSLFEAVDLTIKSENENSENEKFKDIISTTDEMIDRLSEENLAEFTLDKWMAIYKKAIEKRNIKNKIVSQQNTSNTENYGEKKSDSRIPFNDIEVSLGAPWINAEMISQFAQEVLKVKQKHYVAYDRQLNTFVNNKKIPIVQHEHVTGYWHVEKYKWMTSPELVSIYGTKRYNAMYILEASLNLRQIKIHDGTKYNEVETILALEKQKILQEAFKEWVSNDKNRRQEIEDAYNAILGDYVVQKFDGSSIEFEGKSPDIELFDYQKDAVKKIISTPNTLLSFDVGAGKTYIMIAAAMEMRKSGLSRKNMFVVPNNIVGQWEKMFTELYPQAKVLTVEPKSFTPEKRSKVLDQMQMGDYDGIIIAYSCFSMIPLSSEYIIDEMNNVVKGFTARIAEVRKQTYFPGAERALQSEITHVKKAASDLISCIGTDGCEITFDSLDINTLFVDEAHNFKNIPLRTNMREVRGVNTKGSKKCLEMLKKVHYVQKMNCGRGVVFATGTPLCNSISDTFAMQSYLQHEELKKKGLDNFDSWVATFSQPEQVCEIDVDTSRLRIVNRFARFFNLPELSKMFSQVSIFYSVDQSGLPNLLGYSDTVIKRSDALGEYMLELFERTKKIRAKEVDRSVDNMLKVATDGRKAALNLALVGKSEDYDEYSKIYHCVKNTMDIYRRFPESTQLIFCDYSTPKKSKFNIYSEVKKRLMEAGVPACEIAFIHSCKNEEQKVELYENVNSAKVRILIGSTFKLGIGANVQKRLKAISHLDVPWRPCDLTQREGRILRRGNENEDVHIFRYITQGSFDSYSWQILQTKQHFISQFLSGNNKMRSINDFDNDELNYAQVKSIALSEPLMKNYAEKESELKNARIVLRQELEQKEVAKLELKELQEEIDRLANELDRTRNSNTYIKENIDSIKADVAKMCEIITKSGIRCNPNEMLGRIGEFKVISPITQSENKKYIILERENVEYFIEISESVSGNKTRLMNFFNKFNDQISARENRIKYAEEKKSNLKGQATYTSDVSQKIETLEKELFAIFEEIRNKDEKQTGAGQAAIGNTTTA